MIRPRFFLSLVLLVCGFVCSGALARGSDGELPNLHHPGGPAGGLFDAPARFRPGQMVGALSTRRGEALFAIDAVVVPGGPFAHGILLGQATDLAGPGEGRQVPLRGVWVEERPGHGHFHAVLLRPDADGDGRRLEPFLEIDGRFHDRNGPVPPPGVFTGRWEPLP